MMNPRAFLINKHTERNRKKSLSIICFEIPAFRTDVRRKDGDRSRASDWTRAAWICTETHSAVHKAALTSHNIGGVGGWNVDLANYPSTSANVAYGEVKTVHRKALFH